MRTYLPLLFLFFLIIPASAYAALVNINTADAALLDTLPGIGPSKADAIIQYRTEHGPFARIEDIQNVSGIGPSTYAQIAPLITVGGTTTSDTSGSVGDATSSTPNAPAASSGSSTYVPPPSSLSVDAGPDTTVVLGAPASFSASVKTKNGASDPAAQVSWSFGDGSMTTGNPVVKTYQYAGTYLVEVRAQDGATSAADDAIVTVVPARVSIAHISGEGITLANDADERLDLSGWRLLSGTGTFRIPDGTILLPHAAVLFPSVITNLPISFDTTLAFPNGLIATQYAPPPPAPAAQPSPVLTSSSGKQSVEPAFSNVSVPTHAIETVMAPSATTGLAALGAAVSAAPAASKGLLSSPWLYGLLGVVTIAGGAFLIL